MWWQIVLVLGLCGAVVAILWLAAQRWLINPLKRWRLHRFRAVHRDLMKMNINIFQLNPTEWQAVYQRLKQETSQGCHSYEWFKTIQLLAEQQGLNPYFGQEVISSHDKAVIKTPPTGVKRSAKPPLAHKKITKTN